jgi:hypothetical protein
LKTIWQDRQQPDPVGMALKALQFLSGPEFPKTQGAIFTTREHLGALR